jgi:hypothetical protein
MSRQILPLLIRSARLQQKIAAVSTQRNPDRLLILRLQTLRLMIQKRIHAIAVTFRNADQIRPLRAQSGRAHAGSSRSALALN